MLTPGQHKMIQAKKDMEALRRKFNEELLHILEEEQNRENDREN